MFCYMTTSFPSGFRKVSVLSGHSDVCDPTRPMTRFFLNFLEMNCRKAVKSHIYCFPVVILALSLPKHHPHAVSCCLFSSYFSDFPLAAERWGKISLADVEPLCLDYSINSQENVYFLSQKLWSTSIRKCNVDRFPYEKLQRNDFLSTERLLFVQSPHRLLFA